MTATAEVHQRQHHTLGQNVDVYFERMRASLGDKQRLLQYVTGNDVVDVGCGSGELIQFLNESGHTAYGIDPSVEAINKSKENGIDVRQGYADETHLLFGEESLDTVITSSVLHEVFSYGNRGAEPGRISSVSDALLSFYKVLRPGGRLIIRDGVMPNSNHSSSYLMAPQHEVEKFIKHSLFTAKRGEWKKDRWIDLELVPHITDEHGNIRVEGLLHSLMEFAFTYTWGPESFEREVKEFYGVFNLKGYEEFARKHGFNAVLSYAYTQPGYPKHLAEKNVKFGFDFPHSNAIWVFEKK